MSAAKAVKSQAAKGHIEARHYDVIVAPVITEKATYATEMKPGRVQGPQGRDQARDQGRRRAPVRRQGRGRQHAHPQRQAQGLQGQRGQQSDLKKAVVTLADGDRIDVTTGL